MNVSRPLSYTRAIVVLGCGIDAAGVIGADAQGSVRLAKEALESSSDACIVMSGNVSYKATFRPSISEAQGMKDYAVSLGIPSDRIFVETESKDTVGNLVFTKQNVLRPLGITDVTVVRGPNQSDNRIQFLIGKILGPEYSVNIVRPDIERPEEAEREQRSLAVATEWLSDIKDGDDIAVYELLRRKHPGYNSAIPLESLKQLF